MGGTWGGSRGTGGAEWRSTGARRGNALSDGPHRRMMAAVPKVPGMAIGEGERGRTGRQRMGRNGNGGVTLFLGTAEAAPAPLLEALIPPWFGIGRKWG